MYHLVSVISPPCWRECCEVLRAHWFYTHCFCLTCQAMSWTLTASSLLDITKNTYWLLLCWILFGILLWPAISLLARVDNSQRTPRSRTHHESLYHRYTTVFTNTDLLTTLLTEPNSTLSNLILLLPAYTMSSYTGNELYLVASL